MPYVPDLVSSTIPDIPFLNYKLLTRLLPAFRPNPNTLIPTTIISRHSKLKGLAKQLYFPGVKRVQVLVFCFFNQRLYQCTYIMVRTDHIRTERVNEETLLQPREKTYFHAKLQVHQLMHCNVRMYVVRT